MVFIQSGRAKCRVDLPMISLEEATSRLGRGGVPSPDFGPILTRQGCHRFWVVSHLFVNSGTETWEAFPLGRKFFFKVSEES